MDGVGERSGGLKCALFLWKIKCFACSLYRFHGITLSHNFTKCTGAGVTLSTMLGHKWGLQTAKITSLSLRGVQSEENNLKIKLIYIRCK